jgi:hypothetical protein
MASVWSCRDWVLHCGRRSLDSSGEISGGGDPRQWHAVEEMPGFFFFFGGACPGQNCNDLFRLVSGKLS